jgi:hypothetical protein
VRVIRKKAAWFESLSGRCHQRHFPHSDPLKLAADRAFEAVSQLTIEIEKLRAV